MKKIIIANWKMKLGIKESIDLTKKIKNDLIKQDAKIYDKILAINDKWKKRLDLVICPSFVSLSEIKKIIANTGIYLGSQDIFWEEKGAYTGEICASMLKEAGAKYVIIGHSERRKHLKETDEMANKKLKLAFEGGLIPILCIGETFEERKEERTDCVIIKQLLNALENIDIKKDKELIIAYEPVWAIGFKAGKAIEPAEADLSAKIIKNSLLNLFSQKFIDNNIKIIYGGSVSEKDAKSFLDQPNICGALIGTASLDAEKFLKIIKSIN